MSRINGPSRRQFLERFGAAAAVGALGGWPVLAEPPTPERPNLLWIVSEDNSPLLGCYGDTQARTPRLDRFAAEAVRYRLAFAPAPVCAPCRSSMITGMLASSLGTLHMRSNYSVPEDLPFFPQRLRRAGYYCTNNAKEDYNTPTPENLWDASNRQAHYDNRHPGQPFFAVFNIGMSHESALHHQEPAVRRDPAGMQLPPYLPDTPAIRLNTARYYEAMERMDAIVGRLLDDLERRGLADHTIVFYYSDHGGTLPRSKRFLYDSGTRVPMIVRFPKKFEPLAPAKPGAWLDQPVSLLDVGPTVLSMAGVKPPASMQGRPFLGRHAGPARRYVHLFRGRMDECYDCVRGVRDDRYLYIRNYMPHRIYGQHLTYLWKAPAMRSWHEQFQEGRCNAVQSRFWGAKPTEELYDTHDDPHNIRNLADAPAHRQVLLRMRRVNREHLLAVRDAGFLPEAEMVRRAAAGGTTIRRMTTDPSMPLQRIIETAELASTRDAAAVDELIRRLVDQDSGVRYWAATGCAVRGPAARHAGTALHAAVDDESPSVRVVVAEALVLIGNDKVGLGLLDKCLAHHDPRVVLHAVNVVQALGRDAEPVLATVERIADQHDSYVRNAARWAIASLGG